MGRKIRIFDCTLRDGEQSPGVVFTPEEKLAFSRKLVEAGVHVLDAAFPAASQDERDTIRLISSARLNALVGATCRAVPEEIEMSIECGANSVFVFLPVSDIHIRSKLNISHEEIEKRLREICGFAVSRGIETFFVAEDSARQDVGWVARLCDIAASSGAHGAILCDTVGVMTPDDIRQHVRGVREKMAYRLPLGIHCHNDFGMASANTVTAVVAGVDIVTCTVNGIGERAGNAALEEVVASLEELLGIHTGIDLSALPDLSLMLEEMSGVLLPPTKPVVGRNVFTHESGIHVQGHLKNRMCYESLAPERVGRRSRMVFGKHSGRALVRHVLSASGIECTEDHVTEICTRLKEAKERAPKDGFFRIRELLDEHYRNMTGVSEQEFYSIVEEVTSFANR